MSRDDYTTALHPPRLRAAALALVNSSSVWRTTLIMMQSSRSAASASSTRKFDDVEAEEDAFEMTAQIKQARKFSTIFVYVMTIICAIQWIWQNGGCGDYISGVMVSYMGVFLIIMILCETGMPDVLRSRIKVSPSPRLRTQ